MAVSVAVNLLSGGVIVLVFPCEFKMSKFTKTIHILTGPVLMDNIGITGALSIFAGLNVVAFVLVLLFVPETRMRTLEELQYTFDLPTRWHVAYRMGYIRKHIRDNWWGYLTRKDVDPPIPFYEWARITHDELEHAA